MSTYEIYVFVLCFIVFTLLTGLFSYMLTKLVQNYIKLVNAGLEDENIKIEYVKQQIQQNKPSTKVLGYVSCAFLALVTVFMLAVFVFSMVVEVNKNSKVGDVPMLKVVKSDSMSYKLPQNEYLFKNNLNNQIKTFDLVTLSKLPPENELKQYDVVAYERDGNLILHRIVNIEEPNKNHPKARYFLLQGDAVGFHDAFPVLYKDMKGIYAGKRVPFVGSFFMFMQSPAGYLCILLIIFAIVATPLVERKLNDVKKARLDAMDEFLLQQDENLESEYVVR